MSSQETLEFNLQARKETEWKVLINKEDFFNAYEKGLYLEYRVDDTWLGLQQTKLRSEAELKAIFDKYDIRVWPKKLSIVSALYSGRLDNGKQSLFYLFCTTFSAIKKNEISYQENYTNFERLTSYLSARADLEGSKNFLTG